LSLRALRLASNLLSLCSLL